MQQIKVRIIYHFFKKLYIVLKDLKYILIDKIELYSKI